MSDELLERLLAAWADTHDPALEDAIIRIGRGIARVRGPLEPARERDWNALAAAGDAGDVDRLLDTRWPEALPAVIARVQKLAQLPPDPRISRKLAVLARRLPWTRTLDVHVAIALAILRAPTPAALPMLAVDEMPERRRKEDPYAAARTAISALAPRAADPALLAEARAIAGEGSDLAALWAAHDADPDDEQRRAVLGDALQLANDPRGELIQLQLSIAAGNPDRRARARVARLLERHLDEWCTPFPRLDRRYVRFERGFVTSLHVEAIAGSLVASLDRPAWRTVEELSVFIRRGPFSMEDLLARLPRLRSLVLSQLYSAPSAERPYPGLRAFGCVTSWMPDKAVFPDLRVAAGTWQGAQLQRVHAAAASFPLDAIVHLGASYQTLPELAASRRFGPAETRIVLTWYGGFLARGWILRMSRTGPVADLAWREGTPPPSGGVSNILLALRGAGISRVRVYAPRVRPAPDDPIAEATSSARAIPGITIEPGETFDLAAPA